MIETIVVPMGILLPETSMPTASVVVEEMLLTTALRTVVLPVMGLTEKVSATPLAAGSITLADKVIWVSELID